MAIILGLDIATSSLAGVLVNTDQCRVLDKAGAPNDAAVPTDGHHTHPRDEQAPARLLHQAATVMRQLGRTAKDKRLRIDGIGITGQMHGMLLIDGQRQPLSNLITWQDSRAYEVTGAAGQSYVEEMIDRAPREAWRDSGCLPAAGYMGATLYWMKRNDVVPSSAAKVAFIHDWIAAELADTEVGTDPSDAAGSGIFDLTCKGWSKPIVESLGLPAHLLPEIKESGTVIGHLSQRWAQELDLPQGIPVCNAVGDNQASFLGSVATVENSILLNFGTGGQISWAIDHFLRSEGMDTRYLPVDRFLLVGASLCGGKAYSWLADFYGEVVAMTGTHLDKNAIYQLMNSMATNAIPGAQGLRVQPTMMGTRTDPDKRGLITGIGRANFSPANLTRSLLEGMVEELWHFYQSALPESRTGHTRVVASGNGVRRNPLLARIIARRFDLPVYLPQHTEEASFGAALVAGVGMEVFPDLDAAGRCIQYMGAIA